MGKVFTLSLLGLCASLNSCSDSSDQSDMEKPPKPGDYYWFISADDDYKVLKVLVIKPDLIHFCYYNNVFKEEPAKDVISSLYFGKYLVDDMLIDKNGSQQTTGRKHITVTFNNWDYLGAHYLDNRQVTSDEMIAYEEWKNGKQEVLTFKFLPGN